MEAKVKITHLKRVCKGRGKDGNVEDAVMLRV